MSANTFIYLKRYVSFDIFYTYTFFILRLRAEFVFVVPLVPMFFECLNVMCISIVSLTNLDIVKLDSINIKH